MSGVSERSTVRVTDVVKLVFLFLVLLATRLQTAEAQTQSQIACSSSSRPARITNNNYGWIASPNYPATYPNNADCQWLIQSVYTNGYVSLFFNDFFTEPGWDVVNIYNGSSLSAPLLATVAGLPVTVVAYRSTQTFLLLRFTSDSSVVHRGFNATYNSVASTITTTTTKATTTTTTTAATKRSTASTTTTTSVATPKSRDISTTATTTPDWAIVIIVLLLGAILCVSILMIIYVKNRREAQQESCHGDQPTERRRENEAIAYIATGNRVAPDVNGGDAGESCVICMVSPQNAVLLPCRHGSYCFECANALLRLAGSNCPMCRQRIENILQIFR